MKTMVKSLWTDPKAVRKMIAALIGAVLIALSNGLLPPEAGQWVEVVVGFATVAGVYGVRNRTPQMNSSRENI